MSGTVVPRRVQRYDGSTIWVDDKPVYEIGNYLGSGSAGVVHEVHDLMKDKVSVGGFDESPCAARPHLYRRAFRW